MRAVLTGARYVSVHDIVGARYLLARGVSQVTFFESVASGDFLSSAMKSRSVAETEQREPSWPAASLEDSPALRGVRPAVGTKVEFGVADDDPARATRVSLPVTGAGVRRIDMFHDAENCYFSCVQTLRGHDMYDRVVEEVKATSGLDLDRSGPIAVSWYMFMQRWNDGGRESGAFIFRPTARLLEDLFDKGVCDMRASATKASSVDTLMEESISRYIESFRSHQDPRPSQRLVVLFTGDRDFTKELRALNNAGFRTMLFYGNHHQARLSAFVSYFGASRRQTPRIRVDPMVPKDASRPRPFR